MIRLHGAAGPCVSKRPLNQLGVRAGFGVRGGGAKVDIGAPAVQGDGAGEPDVVQAGTSTWRTGRIERP
jgi:hypothetical protein